MPCFIIFYYLILQKMINNTQKQTFLHQIPTIQPIPSTPLKKIKYRKPRTYTWTLLEQEIYLKFLKENLKLMLTTISRRTNKVFKVLSKIMKTRNPIQAKTHHQKLQKKFGSIYSIIAHLQDYIQGTKLKYKEKQVNTTLHPDQQSSLRDIVGISCHEYPFLDLFQPGLDVCERSSQIPKLMFSIDAVTQKLVFVHVNEGDDDHLYN